MHNASPITLQHRVNHVQDWMHKASYFMLMLLAFGLPWSTALFRISVYGLIICLLLSGKWKEKWQASAAAPEFWLGAGLCAIGLLSLLTSEVPLELARVDLQRLFKLLFIGVVVYLMNTHQKGWGVFMALCAGSIILMLPTVLDGAKISSILSLPIEKFRNQAYHGVVAGIWTQNLTYFHSQIVHGFFVSILCFTCLVGAVHFRRYRVWLVLLAIVCAIDVAFFIRGRMALVSLIACFFIFALIQIKSLKGKVIAIVLLCGLSVAAYLGSSSIQRRVDSITSETTAYFQQGNIATGTGHRFYYWSISINLFKESPLLGAGAGSFRHHLEKTKDPFAAEGHSHTHNEYLTIASQYGLAGLGLFLSLLGIAIYRSRQIRDPFLKDASLGAILIFSLNCLTDSMLYNVFEGWAFVLFLALIASAAPSKIRKSIA
jgi:O-antigen ligase